ncbi:MAG TPA: FAD/NAD(P)-binding protein [Luteibacter sp.]|nr:FAD/NAD(P)-binding protein [Luteibacter sp.]
MMFRRVAIIGGGAAGATLMSELLERRSPHPLHVDWYTGGGTPGRGIAYGTASPRHLLNVRAASMGMFAGKPRGFLEYAQGNDPATGGADFLPRSHYGDYLESEIQRSLRQAAALGHDVRIVPMVVDALIPEKDGVSIVYGDEQARADVAVLAVGSLPPRPLGGVAGEAIVSEQYVVDPWPFLAAAKDDPRPLRVVIIGLGLTAVDVVLQLSERWPNAHFSAISRHGLLPEAHKVVASAPADDGAELVEAMRDDPSAHAWMKHLREAIGQGSDWRSVIDGLRPHTPSLWQQLPQDERARFLRHARWAWERARHRMPPQVAESIAGLETAGRLHRYRGRMREVRRNADGSLEVSIAKRDGRVLSVSADVVIQTVGLNTDAQRTAHPLIQQLVTNGHVTPDPLGMGLLAQANGQLLDRNGQPWPSLYAIGTLLRSSLWESTAMPEIRAQARNLADVFVDEVKRS